MKNTFNEAYLQEEDYWEAEEVVLLVFEQTSNLGLPIKF